MLISPQCCGWFQANTRDSRSDYWRFTKYGLQELFKEWEIVELISETTNFATLAVLLQRIAFQSRLLGNKLSKGILFLLARILPTMNALILEQFGDIRKTFSEEHIAASGYYLVARRKL